MKKLLFLIFLAIGVNAFGQSTLKTAKSPREFIPAGYVVFDEIQGDLNGDKQTDLVFIIKGTNKEAIVADRSGKLVDLNSRGIMIAFKNKDHYELALEHRDCFASENEDGGVYFPPQLKVSIERGNLHIHYAHGRYGYWRYKFRYQNSGFELIGYDESNNRGPIVLGTTSINFITKIILTGRILNEVAVIEEKEEEKFDVTREKFKLSKPIKFGDIADFEEFSVRSLIETR